jgi:hypothetical protein
VEAAAAEMAFTRREAGPFARIGVEPDASPDAGQAERIARLEATVVELQLEMVALRQKIDDLFGD